MFCFDRHRKRKAGARRPSRRPAVRLSLEPLEDLTAPTAGLLDPTFGTGGLVISDLLGPSQDAAQDVAIARQTDGKIVVAGITDDVGPPQLVIARYNTDGSLDDGGASDLTPGDKFGAGGFVASSFGGIFFSRDGVGVAVDTLGRIVVAGNALGQPVGEFSENRDILLARFNADGTPDATFGNGGVVTTDFTRNGDSVPSGESASDVLIAADGKILVAGFTGFSFAPQFAVLRYNADGTLDSGGGFGKGGVATADFSTDTTDRFARATSLAIDSQGRIVAAGTAERASRFEAVAARFTADGRLDTSFAGDGTLETGLQADAFGIEAPSADIVTDSAGRIVVSLSGEFNFGPDLARFDSAGNLDTSFGTGGRLDAGIDFANGLTVDAQNRIVVGVTRFVTGQGFEFALARYTSGGVLDNSFSGDGLVTTDFGGSSDVVRALAIDAQGRIIAVGSSVFSANSDIALARYDSGGTLDGGFGSGGLVTLGFPGSQNEQATDIVAVQSDGKLVVVGETFQPGFGNSDVIVARYNQDGRLDSSFGGGDGFVTAHLGGALPRAATIDAQGRIVVVGEVLEPTGGRRDSLVARFTAGGELDGSFGNGGVVIRNFGSSFNRDDRATSVAIDAQGRIVVAGQATGTFFVARFNDNGSLDDGSAGRQPDRSLRQPWGCAGLLRLRSRRPERDGDRRRLAHHRGRHGFPWLRLSAPVRRRPGHLRARRYWDPDHAHPRPRLGFGRRRRGGAGARRADRRGRVHPPHRHRRRHRRGPLQPRRRPRHQLRDVRRRHRRLRRAGGPGGGRRRGRGGTDYRGGPLGRSRVSLQYQSQ